MEIQSTREQRKRKKKEEKWETTNSRITRKVRLQEKRKRGGEKVGHCSDEMDEAERAKNEVKEPFELAPALLLHSITYLHRGAWSLRT